MAGHLLIDRVGHDSPRKDVQADQALAVVWIKAALECRAFGAKYSGGSSGGEAGLARKSKD